MKLHSPALGALLSRFRLIGVALLAAVLVVITLGAPAALTANAAVTVSVTANGHTRALAGTNIARDAGKLVLYTHVGASTGTNTYGVEASVVGGKVTKVVNRLANGGPAPVVPANGYVLSGHGSGSGYAGDWVLANLRVGMTVRLNSATVTPPPTTPPTAPSGTMTSSTANGQTRALAGTNIARDAGKLVLYTHVGASTGTNTYGVEASVVAGKVTKVVNRLANGGSAAVVPANGYVLSGHGSGSGYAGDWVLANLRVGMTVRLNSGTVTPPTTPPTTRPPTTPPTTTPPTTPPTTAPSGAKMSIWHHRWDGPSLRSYPADVKDNLGIVVLGLAQSAGNGAVSYAPDNGETVAQHAADIRAFEARGIRVLLGFGGAGDGTTITNTTQANNFAASIIALQRTYGFSGVDVDLEPSGTSWSEAALVAGLRKAKASIGTRFMIGVTPGLYGANTARWMSLSRALGNDMSYMAPMLYDFPEAMDSRLTQVTLDKIALMRAAGIPNNKMIMGYMTQPSPGYSASPADGRVMAAAFAEAERRYPGIRAFLWEDKLQRDQNWVGFRKLAVLVNN